MLFTIFLLTGWMWVTSKRGPGMPATGKRNRAPARERERSDLEATGRRRRTIRVPGEEGDRSAPTRRGSDREPTATPRASMRDRRRQAADRAGREQTRIAVDRMRAAAQL